MGFDGWGFQPTKERNKLSYKAKTKKGKGRGLSKGHIYTNMQCKSVCDCPWETSGGAENKVF